MTLKNAEEKSLRSEEKFPYTLDFALQVWTMLNTGILSKGECCKTSYL